MSEVTFLSLEKLATRLGLPRKFLKSLAIEGEIPHLTVGGRLRFREDQVQAALAALAEGQTKHAHVGGQA